MTRPEIERRLREGALRCPSDCDEHGHSGRCASDRVPAVAAEVEKMLGEERRDAIVEARTDEHERCMFALLAVPVGYGRSDHETVRTRKAALHDALVAIRALTPREETPK